MATPNIVPRADSEGGLGTASKYWASAYIDTITTTSHINLPDNAILKLGTSADLQIYHDATDSFIKNSHGNLVFRNIKQDKDILFQGDNGQASDDTIATYFFLDGSAATHDGSATTMLQTVWPDKSRIVLGTDADLQIFHDGSNSRINETGTGNLVIQATNYQLLKGDGGEFIMQGIADAEVSLYYNGSKKFETTAAGVSVTGALTVDEPTTNNLTTAHFKHNQGSVISEMLLENSSGADDTGFDVNFRLASSGVSAKIGAIRTNSPGAGDTDMVFSTSTNGSSVTEALRLDSSQNATFAGKVAIPSRLGVGANSDDVEAALTIKGDPVNTNQPARITNSATDPKTGLFLNSTGNAINEKYGMQFGGFNEYSIGGIFGVMDNVQGSTSGDITIDMCDGTTANALIERVRFTHEGNVGIGTSTPQRKFEVYSDSSGSVIDTHIGGTYSTTNYQGLTFGYAERANTNYRHAALVFERDDGGVGDATGNVYILNSVTGSGATSADLSDAKLSLLKTGSAILAGIPFYSDVAGNSMYTHDVSATDSDADFNTAYGFAAMDAITIGDSNTAIGYSSMSTASKAANNVAVGRQALEGNLLADRNVAVGMGALQNMVGNGGDNHATYNTALGYSAGKIVTTGVQNTLVGGLVGDALTEGDSNTAVGYAALTSETQGDRNVAIGNSTLSTQNNTSHVDAYNIAIGYAAGQSVTTGTLNTLIGGLAGDGISLGSHNIALGYNALGASNAGEKSVAIGSGALSVQVPQFTDATCDYNNDPTIAHDTNTAILVGMRVTGTGIPADSFVKTKTSNTEFELGNAAGDDVSTTGGSVTNGTLTFTGGVESGNTAVGFNAGGGITTGGNNTILGNRAGASLTSGLNNVAIGYKALNAQVINGQNTAVGVGALQKQNVSGHGNNTAVGLHAGKEITTGTSNTIIGTTAGDALTEGDNNIIIGAGAAASAVGVDNEITLGDSSISAIRAQVTSISSLSDRRDKKDIEESVYGLDFLESLKPVTFEWDQRDGNRVGVKDVGFIAQDLQEVDDEYTRLVYESNPDKLEATYGRLIPVLVKAIQELSEEVKALKNK